VHSWSNAISGWGILTHGGAGRVPAEHHEAREFGRRRAAGRAAELLGAGGNALDAAQRAVEVLEDNPRFNAGTGGALNSEAHLEFDAAVMDGADLRAGAVCSLPPFDHPVAVARAVLAEGLHVMHAGRGAARFAERAGFVPADEAAMITEAARERLRQARVAGDVQVWAGDTVGAVAVDAEGNLAAATSTSYLRQRLVALLVPHHRGSRDHAQRTEPSELRDHSLGADKYDERVFPTSDNAASVNSHGEVGKMGELPPIAVEEVEAPPPPSNGEHKGGAVRRRSSPVAAWWAPPFDPSSRV
jgi:hypothetical protein